MDRLYTKTKVDYLRLFDQVGGFKHKFKRKFKPNLKSSDLKPNEFTIKKKYFDMIANGSKTVEGRLNKGRFARLKKGDKITWVNEGSKVDVIITRTKTYPDFESMLKTETLNKVLPDESDLKSGVQVYQDIFKGLDKTHGVIAIGMELLNNSNNIDTSEVSVDTINIHQSKLQEPHYSNILNKSKTFEVRVNDPKRQLMQINDIWIFDHDSDKLKPPIKTKIVDRKEFKSFGEAIRYAGIQNVLPNVSTEEEGIRLYESFKHDEGTYKDGAKKYGVVMFKLELV